MLNSLITGANRGIGLEFVRQLLEGEGKVFAACRNPAEAKALGDLHDKFADRLKIVKLDVRNEDDLRDALAFISKETATLDLLINNAGIFPRGESLGALNAEQMLGAFHNNSVAPILVAQAFRDLLIKAKGKVVNISSGMGSLAQAGSGAHSYRARKAALNMYSRVLANELRSFGVTMIVMHPGWVQTDMGGRGAHLEVKESVSGQIKLIEKLSLQETGQFFRWDGSTIEW